MNRSILTCSLLLLAGCSVAPERAPLSEATRAKLDRARRALEAGDPDAALLITDKLLEADSKLHPARLLAAEANVVLVSKNRGAITASFIEDAIRNYELALDQDPNDGDTLNNLSDVYRMKGDYELGARRALQAAALYRSGDADKFGKSLLRASDNELMIFKLARNAELSSEEKEVQPETQAKATVVLSRLEKVKAYAPGVAYLKASEVYRWLGKSFDEMNELERGIIAEPDHFPLHARYRELRAQRGEENECVSFYRTHLRDHGMNAALAYSLGIAESALGDKHRREGNRAAAEVAYLAATKSFTLCKNNRAQWRDNCNHWIAIEYLSLAKINEEAGDIDPAKAYLRKAFAATPKVAETDDKGVPKVVDSFGAHYFGTMMAIANAVQSGGTKDSLRDGLEFWEEFIALHPEQHGWMYNNAAFNARDYGTALETAAAHGTAAAKQQAAAAAMKLYERSYELYTIAAGLDPEDARTVNDCGLMLVYHLKREYPRAEKLFKQAIRVGTARLSALPATTPADERNPLEEAVGDAWQNLGKMYIDLGKPFEECAPALRESLKYYPKQRRQSALWLRRGTAKRPAENVTKPTVDPRARSFRGVAEAAAKKAAARDFDGALLVLDGVSEAMHGYPPYHFYQGLYSLRYAQQAVQRGGSAGQIDGLFADARINLQRAVELNGEPIEPRLRLAEANYESGEFENAAKIAAALILHITSRGGASEEILAATQRVRALAGYKLYETAKRAGADDPGELAGARNAFRNLERMNKLDPAALKTWSVLEQWAGNPVAAMQVYERALQRAPNDQKLLGEFVELGRTTQQSNRAIALLSKRSDALTAWYTGLAYYYSSFERPASDKPETADRALDAAVRAFTGAKGKNAAYKASCDNRISICVATKGFRALDAEKYAKAESDFLEAAGCAPARIHAPISDGRSIKTGIELVVHHHYAVAKDLPAAIATLEKACAIITNDAGLSNNLGLFTRDHGEQLARRGETDAAEALYEKSLAAYQNAVRLEPKSVRQRNDLVVMLLYYLKRDLESVPRTLRSCIADGEKQLAEDPPEDKLELRDLQESVGDSYQNLGYFQMTYGKNSEAARKNLQKSLGYYPFKTRQSARYLRQLGKK